MDLLNILLGSGRPRKKNTKKSRLNRKLRTIKKLQRKQNSPKYKRDQQLNAALEAADKMIDNLRAGKSAKAKA